MSKCKYQTPYSEKRCDRTALDDSKYCIFHKPEKDKKEAIEFYARIRSEARDPEGEKVKVEGGDKFKIWIFDKKLDWKGYRFPPIPNEEALGIVLFSFRYAIFHKKLTLFDAHFEEEIDFTKAKFKANANFQEAEFDGSVRFAGSNFERGPEVIGIGPIIDGPFIIRGANFVKTTFNNGANFEQSTFECDVLFNQARFFGYNKFMKVHFHEDCMLNKVQFKGAVISTDLHFHKKAFLSDATFKRPPDGELLFRKVRRIWEERGNRERADQMFLREMRVRRKQKNNKWAKGLDRAVADLTCKYGTSWQQVLGVSIFMIIGFGLLYNGIKLGLNNLTNFINAGLGESLYQSAIVFTTLGYDRGFFTGNPLLKAMSAVESAFGALFVALIILVFARKWMRG